MLTFVFIFNGAITLLNCYLVWQLIKFRKQLNELANTLDDIEKKAILEFPTTLLAIRRGEYQTLKFRQNSTKLQQKWQQIVTLVQLLNWLYKTYHSLG